MAKKDHIAFISHSSEDEVIANQLCRFLEDNKISCWIAPRDIPGGKSHIEEVPEAIDKAKIFILIYSEHAPRSRWVPKELISATDAQKLIIPYRIDDSPLPRDMKFALCNCQWINSSDFPDINDAFNELRKSISEALELPLIESNDTTSKPADQGLEVEPNNSQGLKCDNNTSLSANFDSHEDTADTYRRAAELGDPEAQNSLGDCYFFGRGVKKDRNEAIRWYKKAAAQGLRAAQNNLQWLKCDNNTSLSANFDSHEDTADTYRRAAELGDPEAQNHDVFISYSSKNRDVANQLCRFLENNNISCWIAPRNISGGEDYTREVPEAIINASIFVLVYSEYASQSSWVRDEIRIAREEKKLIIPYRIDDSPLPPGVKFTLCNCQWINSSDFPDINDAFNELRKSISEALELPLIESNDTTSKPAQVTVPSYDEVVQDHAKLPLVKELAQNGDPEAQFVLGDCYYNGIGVAENKTEAIKWLQKAAAGGHAGGQWALGMEYLIGKNIPENKVDAVKWFQKAAEQGDADGQYNLGFCYENGIGVSKNATEAVKWYRKAAEQGNALGQHALGCCYVLGQGIPENEAEGTKWLCEAAGQGHIQAIKDLLSVFNFPYSEKEKALMEAMEKIVFQRRNCSRFYVVQNGIPENKLLNVRLSYGSNKNSDSIIALYDYTFWGGAEDGFIVTYTGIVGHNAYQERIMDFDWTEIKRIRCFNNNQIWINGLAINVKENARSLAQMVLDLRNCFNHFFKNYGQYNTAQEILKTMPKERVCV